MTISTENILFAIGSQAKKIFSNIVISGNRVMNSDDILNIKEIPKSLVIIGGGVIGCEFASIFFWISHKCNNFREFTFNSTYG